MALTESQKREAQELFQKGYSTSEVFRHLGAQTIGAESSIDVQESAIKNADTRPALKPIAKKITSILGLDDATQTFGDLISRSRLANVMQTPEQKQAAELNAEMSGQPVKTQQEINQQFVEAPTGKEIAGATLQTAATAAAPAIAPASLGAQVATGVGLGYAYDVGGDLQADSTLAQTLTPGTATAVGAIAPPVIRGLGSALGRTFSTAELLGLPPGPAAKVGEATNNFVSPAFKEEVEQISQKTGGIAAQALEDVADRAKRVGSRTAQYFEDKATRAERLQNATPAVREAIKAEVDDTLIDIVSNADDATKAAFRDMIKLAEEPRTGRAGQMSPTDIAGEKAVEQFDTIVKQKRAIGKEIGNLSDTLPTAKNIDVLPAVRNLRDVLRQNGIMPDAGGTLRFTNEALLPDQQAVIQTLYDKATKNEMLSAKTIHELDQFFSATQRKSRLADKIDDVYVKVKTPDGTTDVNIYKLFRDVFGQHLEEAVPEMKPLNRQYRQLDNLVGDIEGNIARDPNFASLARDERFASAGLRQMFGEGVKSRPLAELYEVMDTQSRQFGYEGPRADELYYVANKLRDIYPDTIPETGLRGNIGSSIKDIASNLIGVGKANAVDQQKALKQLLDMAETAPTTSKEIPLGMSIKAQITPDQKLTIAKRLEEYDASPITVRRDGRDMIEMGDDIDVRLEELQKKNNSGTFTDRDAIEAMELLEQKGVTFNQGAIPSTNLLEEAKGKTLDEFMGKQKPLYHGTNANFTEFKPSSSGEIGKGVYFYDSKTKASEHVGGGGRVVEAYVDGKLATMDEFRAVQKEIGDVSWTNSDTIDELARRGYVGIIRPEGNSTVYNIFNPKDIKTRQSLEDIWKQANTPAGSTSLLEEAKKYKSAEEFVESKPKYYQGVAADETKINSKRGETYFTTNKDAAIGFSEDASFAKLKSKGIREGHPDYDKFWEDSRLKTTVHEGFLEELDKPLVVDAKLSEWDEIATPKEMGGRGTKTTDQITNWAKKNGYDGVIYNNITDGGSMRGQTDVVVFDPSKIKTRTQLEDIWKQANE